MVFSKFDNLPPELIVEISDYLDACDLYHAFYGLNQYITTILDQQCYRLHINLIHISKIKFDLYCNQILPYIGAHVISLTLNGDNSSTPGQLRHFLTRFNPLAKYFVKLESIKLLNSTKSDVENLVTHLSGLIHLKYLSIGDYKRLMPISINTDDLFDETIALPISLRSLAFPYKISNKWIQSLNVTSFIEQLHVHLIHIDSISFFLQTYPNLKRLTAVLSGITENILQSPITFHSLQYLNINITQDVLFDHFASFLRNIPQLRSLSVEALNPDLPFLDAHQWERILPSSLSLFRFGFTMTLPENPDHIELLKPFKSQFWILRHWFVQCRLRDRGRFFRLSTIQSPIITILYWPDDEVLVDSTSIAVYRNVTHIDLWWNLSKSTQSICPNVNSIQLYGASTEENEPFHPNICDLLQSSSLEHIIINNDIPITQFRFASVLIKSTNNVDKLTCSTNWLHFMLQYKKYEWICFLITIRIRKLILVGEEATLSHNDLIAFSRTFINLEEITIKLDSSEDMFFLLNILRQLTMANIELPNITINNVTDITKWIKENTILRDFIVQTQTTTLDTCKIILWIGSRETTNSLTSNENLYLKHSIINKYMSEN
ncbi:unnamed protein product [Adineta steineri]|uniref:F-box domain-containing protein n=1 Tax=Adineta steineri TaxID=433720 RepID=A0A815HS38_9BILA|nr:unnamed protein product [Adineta steineri]CAF1355939.1 unnamed protein product [Adineta steineri]